MNIIIWVIVAIIVLIFANQIISGAINLGCWLMSLVVPALILYLIYLLIDYLTGNAVSEFIGGLF